MLRFPQYLGIAAALVIGGITIILSNEIGVSPMAISATAPTTPAAITVATTSQGTNEKEVSTQKQSAAGSSNASSSAMKVVPAVTPRSKTTAIVVPTPAVANIPRAENVSLDSTAALLRGALVNILCYAPAGSGLHSISGSGVFIDPKGIILTNAHVAQYFLLRDRGVLCTIRTGSPATDAYRAALIYISPTWIHTNANVLTQALPSGTGENDFALLAVTESETAQALPDSFPFIPLAHREPTVFAPVVIASFGAQFLQTSQIQTSLYPTIVFGSIKEVFTFATTTTDVLDLGGSAAAQEGSSGGGVADTSGMLVGTITTSTVQGPTESRSLSAITAAYIRAAYSREMGGSSLDTMLEESTTTSVSEFAAKIPVLESILTATLP